MQNNRARNGVPHFYDALTPMANAIAGLRPGKVRVPPANDAEKLAAAQARRDRKQQRRLQQGC